MIAMVAGLLFDHFKAAGDIRVGYGIMFMICSTAYIIAWFVMHLLVPKFKKIELE
jgi:ACS family hexuronate transporter-like MFS transporter